MNDREYLLLADKIANRSTCTKRHVGAILVQPGKGIIGVGHNGEQADKLNCRDDLKGCYYETIAVDKYRSLLAKNKDKKIRFDLIKKDHRLLCLSVCAEKSAIINAINSGNSVVGSVMYCTNIPCPQCSKIIRDIGICKVVFANDNPEGSAITKETGRIFKESNIKLTRYKNIKLNGNRIIGRADYDL